MVTNATTRRLLTPAEAAKELAVSRQFVYKLAATGGIGAVRLGGVVRIPRAEIERLIESGTQITETAAK